MRTSSASYVGVVAVALVAAMAGWSLQGSAQPAPGKGSRPRVVHFQIRPDPLAR